MNYKQVKNWILFHFVCHIKLFGGHKEECCLIERAGAFYIKRCKRCERYIEVVRKFKRKEIPFGSSEDAISNFKAWDEYCDIREQTIKEYAMERIFPKRLVIIEKTDKTINDKVISMKRIQKHQLSPAVIRNLCMEL